MPVAVNYGHSISPFLPPTTSQSTGAGTTPVVPLGAARVPYPIIDNGQEMCFDTKKEIICSQQNLAFFGQDAQFSGNQSAYTLNSDH